MISSLLKTLATLRWGEWSLITLFISVLSGMVVALQYDPATPLYSSSALDIMVPYGSYFRSLHFYSSQFFFLLAIAHLLAVFKRSEGYTRTQWLKLSATLPVGLLILFTGYILRGDSTGSSAGIIAENILLTIPVLGDTLNDLLLSISDNHMKRVYANHVISLGVLWGALAWEHLRVYRTSFRDHLPLTGIVLLISVLIAAPFEPEQLGVFHISGPWFFLGLQELLRFLPPLVAGVFTPLLLLIALFLLRPASRHQRPLLLFMLIWLLTYGVLSIIASGR
jgi:ubiquinol-cytochrome c reductase cytochrome b subunit